MDKSHTLDKVNENVTLQSASFWQAKSTTSEELEFRALKHATDHCTGTVLKTLKVVTSKEESKMWS